MKELCVKKETKLLFIMIDFKIYTKMAIFERTLWLW